MSKPQDRERKKQVSYEDKLKVYLLRLAAWKNIKKDFNFAFILYLSPEAKEPAKEDPKPADAKPEAKAGKKAAPAKPKKPGMLRMHE